MTLGVCVCRLVQETDHFKTKYALEGQQFLLGSFCHVGSLPATVQLFPLRDMRDPVSGHHLAEVL